MKKVPRLGLACQSLARIARVSTHGNFNNVIADRRINPNVTTPAIEFRWKLFNSGLSLQRKYCRVVGRRIRQKLPLYAYTNINKDHYATKLSVRGVHYNS